MTPVNTADRDHPLAPIAAVLRREDLSAEAKTVWLGLLCCGELSGGAYAADAPPATWLDLRRTCGLPFDRVLEAVRELIAAGLAREASPRGWALVPPDGRAWRVVP